MTQAPPRGCYDRTLSPGQRTVQHAERLLVATAQAVERAQAPARASMQAIVALAGAARNTFYAHYRDVRDAEDAVLSRVLERFHERVDEQLRQARAPIEAFRQLVSGWAIAIDDRRELAGAAFKIATGDRRGGLSRIGAHLRQHLRRVTQEARRQGAVSTPADELRLLAAAASMEALLGWYVDHPLSRDDVVELGTDLLLRAFR